MGYDMYRMTGTEETDYHRLNIFGMSTARDELYSIGIVVNGGWPQWPQLADFGLTEYPDEESDDLTEAQKGYLKACQEMLEGPMPGDTHGIPAYKLGSNDGWLVLPQEVRTGVMWADKHYPGWRNNLTDYVLEFVEWMEGSEEGFRVY